jgi:hypothetical protein
MAITYFQPEVWAAALLGVLDKSLVFAGSPCVNRDYEGEISAYGDTVRITSISDPTISTYTKDTNLSAAEALTDAQQLLYIDQAKSFNFQIDDIDKAQVRNNGALLDEAARRAGFGLRDKADQFVAAKMTGSAGNTLGVVDATTATNVYDALIVPAGVKLDEANVPEEDRWMVLDPATFGKLRLDGRFIKVNESGDNRALRNGYVGEAGGFRLYKSNNAPAAARSISGTVTVATTAATLTHATAGTFSQADVGLTVAGTRITGGSKIASVNADGTVATMDTAGASAGTTTDIVLSGAQKVAVAGSSIATSFAEQIVEVEAYRPELRFGDALKGLHVYGAKVTRATGLVVAAVKTA